MLLGLLLVLEIIVAVALTGVILLQRSEGGALGMGGGPGGFMTARGAGDLLTRTTGILATLFFVLALLLTLVSGHLRGSGSVVDRTKVNSLDPNALKPAVPATAAPPVQPVPVPGEQPAPAAPSVFQAPAPQVNTTPGATPAAPAAPQPAPKP